MPPTPKPVSQIQLFAIKRLALTQQAILRAARLESGLFTTFLNESLEPSGNPVVFMAPELSGNTRLTVLPFGMEQGLCARGAQPPCQGLSGNGDIEITRAQNRNYLLGEGFHRMVQQSNSWSLAIRCQAQAERHYRRAVEEFERPKALRPELPNEPIFDPQPEPKKTTCTPENEPIFSPVGQTHASAAGPLASLVPHENYLARAVEPRRLAKGVWGRLITPWSKPPACTGGFPAGALPAPSFYTRAARRKRRDQS